MGTTGYRYASEVTYRWDEVILEVGSGESTYYLADVGPPVVAIDASEEACRRLHEVHNVEARYGVAEVLLQHWNTPIGFAWLDGHDWPYTDVPPGTYNQQRADYERRGQPYSQEASLASHLAIAQLITEHARVIAFDDTWRTHAYRPDGDGRCVETVPPATTPAPATALNEPIDDDDESICGLSIYHPHHDVPKRGWNGKGGTAIPYLLQHGFDVVRYGLNLVVLKCE